VGIGLVEQAMRAEVAEHTSLDSTFNMGERCGDWLEDGETVPYDPCPPGLEDGN